LQPPLLPAGNATNSAVALEFAKAGSERRTFRAAASICGWGWFAGGAAAGAGPLRRAQGPPTGSGLAWSPPAGRARRLWQGLAECGLAAGADGLAARFAQQAGRQAQASAQNGVMPKTGFAPRLVACLRGSHLERSRFAGLFAERSDQKQRACTQKAIRFTATWA